MLAMRMDALAEFVRNLTAFEVSSFSHAQSEALAEAESETPLGDEDAESLNSVVRDATAADAFFYLPATRNRANRLADAVKAKEGYAAINMYIRVLREALEDELREREFYYMPAGRSILFNAKENLLGVETAATFPDQVADIDEAGKCYGCGRYTAGVFHLMRVMEAGVQALGALLNVQLVDEKNWHNILEEANKAIKGLPKDRRQPILAELGALLFAVKLAWRNEVMHPKASYTEDEATAILQATKAFMTALSKEIAPQATAAATQLAASVAPALPSAPASSSAVSPPPSGP